MSGGRPTKYETKYCQAAIAFMGQGYSKTAFAGSIGVARDTLNEWASVHPEFSAAIKVGQSARVMCLEQGLLSSEMGPRVTARIFALKNADPEEWRDKPDEAKAPVNSFTMTWGGE